MTTSSNKKTFRDETFLGNIKLKNRFIRAAVGDHTDSGHLSEANMTTYRNLARGGAAALITGFTVVESKEQVANIFSLAEDSLIAEYSQLTKMIHEEGTKVISQLVYLSGMFPISRPLAPSAGKNIYSQTETFEMTKEEIKEMEQKFAQAAFRAKKAGFDGVELHCAHGFLHHQFFSPLFNHREDAYGGNIENRSRFIIETYQRVREMVGDDFTIMAKISVEDGAPGGVSEEDYLYLSEKLSEMGINAIEVSGMWHSHKPKERLYYRDAAIKIANKVSCKVIQTGGNRELDVLEDELNSSNVEYFGFARPFICQPDWVNLYLAGVIQKPNCLSCNFCIRNAENICVLKRKNIKK